MGHITVTRQFTIRKAITSADNFLYRTAATRFTYNVAATVPDGPTPGSMVATYPGGTDIDLSKLTTPGICRVWNVDPTNNVILGAFDSVASVFYPVLKIRPGHFHDVELAGDDLDNEYGTGTGTVGGATHTLRVRPENANCNVVVEAFEA